MSVFRPARQYLPASLATAALAAVSAWCGSYWPWAFVPAVIFVAASGALYYLGSRPAIEFSDRELRIGATSLPWGDIRRVEATAWTSPLILNLTLRNQQHVRLIYAGDAAAASRLSQQIRRRVQESRGSSGRALAEPWSRARLLRPEDEMEVERLYQRLRTAGRLDVWGADE